MCVQTHRHLSTRKPLLRAFWGQASAVLNFGEPTICRPAQGSGQRAVRRGGDPRIPGGQDRRRTDARSRTSSEDADLLGCSTCRGSGGLGELFGRGDPWAHSVAALGPEPEDHPRGCLRVGSWVTARATEPCPRSQVYAVPAGTRRLSSGVKLSCCPPTVTTEEPSWERGAGE